MKYGIHPSKELVRLFSEKPYQGQNPEKAKILIIGNDANYSPEISTHKFFENILEYHRDGVSFWKKTGKHHPFLLSDYPFNRTTGGVPYHKNFSKMHFEPEDAGNFSFVELLNVPTTGNTNSNKELFFEFLDKDHLKWLESLILRGKKKFVAINQTLAKSISKINKRLGVLDDLVTVLKGAKAPFIVLETPNVVLYNGYNFSYMGISDEYLRELSLKMQVFLRKEISGS